MRILHVGGYPPPIGGITIHIKRLDMLCRQAGLESCVFDPYGSPKRAIPPDACVKTAKGSRLRKAFSLLRTLRDFDGQIVHFHFASLDNFLWIAPLALALTRRQKRVGSLHAGISRTYLEHNKLLRWWLRWTLVELDFVVTANDAQRQFLIDCLRMDGRRIATIPPFLPPPHPRQEELQRLIPSYVTAFGERFESLALITGYCLPLYGFHTAIEALSDLADLGVGLIIHMYTSADPLYKAEILRRSTASSNILLTDELEQAEFFAMMSQTRIFIRATSDDGDSVALREAVWLGRQIVATDAVPRPSGTLLFHYNDAAGLATQLRQATTNPLAGICERGLDSGQALLEIYSRLVGDS